ncbi:transmembrane 7 superfamily member 3-like [Penaeus japonicus]|uniref:transmembrane 7 superfamily member 3-like n=1 Tax=Penaeus japonicus TaxID=27405 RepID=UPI001C70CA1C|nr:transmembrane 7 superfamily member 3-like [Penaeus japonicus]
MPYLSISFAILIYLCSACNVSGSDILQDVRLGGRNGTSALQDEVVLAPVPDEALTGGSALQMSCNPEEGDLDKQYITYPMNKTYKITVIPNRTILQIEITDINLEDTGFLIAQAHSQIQYLILSQFPSFELEDNFVNNTNPGIVVFIEDPPDDSPGTTNATTTSKHVYLTNCHNNNVSVLFMVRNYSMHEPVPGGYYPSASGGEPPLHLPKPFLVVEPNILTTRVSYRAASFPLHEKEPYYEDLKYETFLTYMYERDLSERKYWDSLIATSTLEDIRAKAVRVSVTKNNNTAELLGHWFVSYSGVGAVVSVIVSYNDSGGALYSSAVSYGCDFIDAEQYRCTKLVNPLAKLFCASLPFIGALLLFVGHRWLNFTMFTSGFLFSWCFLFMLCAQDTHSNIDALGLGTLVGALLGGILWLIAWHRFQRPFHSSLLLIIMNVIFVGMVVTYFLRYAIVPSSTNLAAFVVFPVFFAIVIIGYSIIDIKKVHIFSCTFLGSYAVVVPFAFYFGSSLTYIVINVIALDTVAHYSEAIGFPPFQVCDIILLCLWLILFITGMAYQLTRERSGPPFHPPSLASWRATQKMANFVFDKVFACLPMDPDPGGAGIEDQPTWKLRLSYCFKLVRQKVSCRKHDETESGYESFQRVRSMSQSVDEPDSEFSASLFARMKERINERVESIRSRFRKEDEELLQQTEVSPENNEDEEQLQDVAVSCCNFRKSQVVLDDAYTNSNADQET